MRRLADTFILLGLPFDSAQAQQLNKEIFEAIYYAGLRTSCQLAQKHGAAHAAGHVSLHRADDCPLVVHTACHELAAAAENHRR